MREIASIWLSKAKNMVSAGSSLARTLYTVPLNILLEGELGTGKTTFLQGFAKGLGIQENITSPTYALEQRYCFQVTSYESKVVSPGLKVISHESRVMSTHPSTPLRAGNSKLKTHSHASSLLHLDLFRLSKREAEKLVDATTGFEGIRCIEWAERLPRGIIREAYIRITLQEGKGTEGRLLTISFLDIPLPSQKKILSWRNQVCLPVHIQKHCDAVGRFAKKLAQNLLQQGIICRPLALQRAGEIHDLFRFLDFRAGGWSGQDSKEDKKHWEKWREKFQGLRHEAACAIFLKEHGYAALAHIVAVHGLTLPPPLRVTIEQAILFYADKRVRIDKIVSLDERFQDFRKRYGSGKASMKHKIWYDEAKRVEQELFPDGPP